MRQNREEHELIFPSDSLNSDKYCSNSSSQEQNVDIKRSLSSKNNSFRENAIQSNENFQTPGKLIENEDIRLQKRIPVNNTSGEENIALFNDEDSRNDGFSHRMERYTLPLPHLKAEMYGITLDQIYAKSNLK